MDAGDRQDIARDIAALQAIRAARAEFNARLVEASAGRDPEVIAALVQETAYQLCEFYWLLDALEMRDPANFEGLVDRHNSYLEALLATPDKMQRLGLKKERVLQSIFDGETRPRLLQQWREEPGTLDQSNLARFLVPVMSTETARKLVHVFERAGFMTRRTTVYGSVLVRSTGAMEEVYGTCLRRLRQEIARVG